MSPDEFRRQMEDTDADNHCCLTADSYDALGNFDLVNAKLGCYACFNCWGLVLHDSKVVSCNPTTGAYVKWRKVNWITYVFETFYLDDQYGWYEKCETSVQDNGSPPSCAPWFQYSIGLDECNLSFEIDTGNSYPSGWSSYTGSGVSSKESDSSIFAADGTKYAVLEGIGNGIYQSYTAQSTEYKVSFYSRNEPSLSAPTASIGVFMDNVMVDEVDLSAGIGLWYKHEFVLPTGQNGNLGFKITKCSSGTSCVAHMDMVKMVRESTTTRRLQPNFGDASSGPEPGDSTLAQVPFSDFSGKLGNPRHANGYLDGYISKNDLFNGVGRDKCVSLAAGNRR